MDTLPPAWVLLAPAVSVTSLPPVVVEWPTLSVVAPPAPPVPAPALKLMSPPAPAVPELPAWDAANRAAHLHGVAGALSALGAGHEKSRTTDGR